LSKLLAQEGMSCCHPRSFSAVATTGPFILLGSARSACETKPQTWEKWNVWARARLPVSEIRKRTFAHHSC